MSKSKKKDYPSLIVVTVGASAGGLEALTLLLKASKPTGHIAFVLAQHMAPQHRSLLVELLSKDVAYKVISAKQGTVIEADTVYVNPPNKDIMVVDGALSLKTPTSAIGAKPSIDKLFQSVAEEYGDRSIGVVLSGTGSDGTQGCRYIRDSGGIVIAQDPGTAKYDGMPQSAIRARVVDQIIPPQEIAEYLVSLKPDERPKIVNRDDAKGEPTFEDLIDLVYTTTGVDFRYYKQATLERQVQRRIVALRLSSTSEYIEYVQSRPEEVEVLQRSFLISVTSFFRDTEAFAALDPVIKRLAQTASTSNGIRVWIPACATGEEVYSIAILIMEALGDNIRRADVKIFATDIDDVGLEVAREGSYNETAFENMPPDLVERYFDKFSGKYRVKKWLRDVCMFARHDIVSDPPFLNMSLVSCRNLLIYLESSLQNQLISNFHYSLRGGGYLFLGKSEAIGTVGEKLFEVLDKSNKLYHARLGVASKGRFGRGPISMSAPQKSNTNNVQMVPESVVRTDVLAQKARSQLMDRFCPASVFLSEDFQPVEYFGDLAPFLQVQAGRASFDIVSLTNKQIQTEIRALVNRASRTHEESVVHNIRFRFPGDEAVSMLTLTISRLFDIASDRTGYVLSFERKLDEQTVLSVKKSDIGEEEVRANEELETELARTRDHLQAVIEELETSNEELQSLNEELQASTEELQASNEELETTNEELQATNEELTTVNDELQAKSILLTDTNETLVNIQRSLDMGLIVIDRSKRITRFTPLVRRLFGVIDEDVGHLLTKVPTSVEISDLDVILDSVISTGEVVRRELMRDEERFLMNVSPYRMEQGEIGGAVVTFTETTKLNESQQLISRLKAQVELIDRSLSQGVVIYPVGFERIDYASGAIESIWKRKRETLYSDCFTLLDGIANADRDAVELKLKSATEPTWSLETEVVRRDRSVAKVELTAVSERNETYPEGVVTLRVREIEETT